MAIPTYQQVMLPLLQYLGDGATRRIREVTEALADHFALGEAERREQLPSGQDLVFRNRVRWAKLYLERAGLVESPGRGLVRISDRGREVLADPPPEIDAPYLKRFADFVAFREQRHGRAEDAEAAPAQEGAEMEEATPEEALEASHSRLRQELEAEVLELVKAASPAFFEQLVVDLLVAMGYGGSIQDAGAAVGRSGDGGIDGIIKEDQLGLDAIYVQAKRWAAVVGRPELHKFAGALQGQRARKGVFITTSSFTRDAKDYVSGIDSKVVLIDGATLARLMVQHNVGVTPVRSYEVKRVDSDYFSED